MSRYLCGGGRERERVHDKLNTIRWRSSGENQLIKQNLHQHRYTGLVQNNVLIKQNLHQHRHTGLVQNNVLTRFPFLPSHICSLRKGNIFSRVRLSFCSRVGVGWRGGKVPDHHHDSIGQCGEPPLPNYWQVGSWPSNERFSCLSLFSAFQRKSSYLIFLPKSRFKCSVCI